MKIHGLRLRGIGRFHDDLTIPIDQLGDAKLVAIVGKNGAGKTTAIEAVPGAIFRSTPSRGSLARLANRRDSFVELDVETTRRVMMRLLVDGVAKPPKSEGVITPGAESGKFRDYDALVAQLFPTQELFLASAFSVQGGRGRFLDLDPAERKEMFATLLGSGHLQELSEKASKQHLSLETERAKMLGQIDAIERGLGGGVSISTELAQARRDLDSQRTLTEDRRRDVTKARDAMEAWREVDAKLRETASTARNRVNEIYRHIDSVKSVVRDLMLSKKVTAERISTLEAMLAMRGELEVKAMEAEDLRERIAAAEQRRDSDTLTREREREAEVQWTLVERDLEARGQEAATALKDVKREVSLLETKVADASRAQTALKKVPCGGQGPYAGCHLIANAVEVTGQIDALIAAQKELLAKTTAAEEALYKAREAYKQHQAKRPQRTVAFTDWGSKIATMQELLRQAEDARAKVERYKAVDEELVSRRADLERVSETLASHEEKLRLEQSDAVAAEAVAKSAAENVALNPAPPSPEAAEARLQTEERLAVEIEKRIAALENRQAFLEAEKARHAEAMAQLEALVADIDDWKYLRDAFGRVGIQALEIDAAGPEVSALTNRLLHACYGSRFTVSLETTQLKADGKGTKEVFTLRVIDNENGVELDANDLSGGEKVLVSEALALAISIYNCERSAIPLRTLFRDECSGALHHENAMRYVEMLRRAIELGGFDRCYFIAHQPDLWGLADKRLVFEDGNCRIA